MVVVQQNAPAVQKHPGARPPGGSPMTLKSYPCRIPLRARDGSTRAYAWLDGPDYEVHSQHRWCLNRGGYAVRRKGKQVVYLHREILGLEQGTSGHVDHINGDKLDNRRSNLRHDSVSRNQINRRQQSNNKSGHRGVYWSKDRDLWVAQIKPKGQPTKFLGHFHELDKAVEARKAGELRYFGELCP